MWCWRQRECNIKSYSYVVLAKRALALGIGLEQQRRGLGLAHGNKAWIVAEFDAGFLIAKKKKREIVLCGCS